MSVAVGSKDRVFIIVLLMLALLVGAAIGTGGQVQVFLGMISGAFVCVIGVALGGRRILWVSTVVSLVVGSSQLPGASSSAFYLRFFLMGAVVASSLTFPKVAKIWFPRGITRLALALVWFAFLSTAWSISPGAAAQRSISLLLLFLVLASAVSRVWSSREMIERDVQALVLVLGLGLLVGLVAFGAGAGFATSGGRLRGVMGNANTVGLMCALVVPISVGLLVGKGQTRKRWSAICLATAVVSLFLSQSRGGLVAAAFGSLLVLGLVGVLKRPDVWAIVCLLLLPLAIAGGSLGVRVPGPFGAVAQRFEGAQTGTGRVEAWSIAVDVTRQRPIAGWGFASTEGAFTPQPDFPALVHNSYLQVALELGLLGASILFLLLVKLFRSAWPGRNSGGMEAGVYGAIAAGAISVSFESALLSVGSVFAYCFWTLGAAALRFRSLRVENEALSLAATSLSLPSR